MKEKYPGHANGNIQTNKINVQSFFSIIQAFVNIIIIQLEQMTLFPRKKHYSKISYEKRLRLIQMVEDEHLTIARAAKKLHIKVPTAKVILSNYFKNGRIYNKKCSPKEKKTLQGQIIPLQLNHEEEVPCEPMFNMQIMIYNFFYNPTYFVLPSNDFQ